MDFKYSQIAKYGSEIASYLKKILKELNYDEEELRDFMQTEEKRLELINIIYKNFPTHLKLKVSKETFEPIIIDAMEKQLKKKKNKKLVFGKNKKEEK